MVVIKQVSNDAPHKGDRIIWAIIVTNHGPDVAVNTIVTDKLPSGLVFENDNSKGAYNPKTGIWKVGDLASGQSKTLRIVTKVVTTNKTIINIADVTSDTYDPNEANNRGKNSTTVDPEADLVITVNPSATKVTVGDKVEYEITVVNNGPDSATNTRAYIHVPDSLKLIGFKPSKGTYDPTTGIWNIGDLAPGEKVTLILQTEALKSGIVVVKGNVTSDTYDPNTSNNNDTAVINVSDSEHLADKIPTYNKKMLETGNPIAMVILALLTMVGVAFKRKN